MKHLARSIAGSLCILFTNVFADVELRKTGDAWQLVVDGTPFIARAIELQNYDYLDPTAIQYLNQMIDYRLAYNVNALLVPFPWNAFEPTKGAYDYRMIDSLIVKCRARNMRVVILWFATWKNGGSGYAPAWLLNDPNVFMMQGDDGKPSTGISPFCAYALEADKRAYTALMTRIKMLDENHHTVLMVQPENEVGGFPAGGRDFCPLAEAAWNAPVPVEMMNYLNANKGALVPWLEQLWRKFGYRSGTWAEVFGNTWEGGPQAFLGYYLARYCGEVAAAGKAVYNLPMFCNWGYGLVCGPSWMTIDMWKVAAPSVNAVAGDIYESDFEFRLSQYDRQGNPVLVPESGGGFARGLWTYIEHNGILFSRYEGEGEKFKDWNNGSSGPCYALIRDLEPLIIARNGNLPRTMRAWNQERIQAAGTVNTGVFDGYGVSVAHNQAGNGILVMFKMGDNEYVVGGAKVTMQLRRLYDPASGIGVTSANRGHFTNGQWSNDNAVTPGSGGDNVSYTFTNDNNQLEFVRFRLSGTAPKPEMAFRRATRASSWQDNGHSRQANDDLVSSDWVSASGQQPWWQVDLEKPCRIAAVQVVASQANANSSWRTAVEIQASNTPDFAAPSVLGSQGSMPFADKGTLTLTVQNANEYRYVRIRKADNATQFGFAEARIFGDPGATESVEIPKGHIKESETDEFRVIRTNGTMIVIRTMVTSDLENCKGVAETEAQIFDCSGRILLVRRGTGSLALQTGGIHGGVYLLRLRSGTATAVRTIVWP